MVLAACFRLFSFAQWVKPALCCSYSVVPGAWLLPLFSGIQHSLYGSNDDPDFPVCQFIWTSSMSNPGFCLGMASTRQSSSPITEHRQTHRSKACIPSARRFITSSADMMFPRRAWWRSARELPPYPRRQNRFVGA